MSKPRSYPDSLADKDLRAASDPDSANARWDLGGEQPAVDLTASKLLTAAEVADLLTVSIWTSAG